MDSGGVSIIPTGGPTGASTGCIPRPFNRRGECGALVGVDLPERTTSTCCKASGRLLRWWWWW
ncbi:hypothetical protein BKA80DRAFT_259976 [Phyllosticta citrichinensis]